MPRSRRRHHSRSRTRSRSNSIERTRDAKRRKIDSYEESHKRSLSSESMQVDDVVEIIEVSPTPPAADAIPVAEESDTTENSQDIPSSSQVSTPKRTVIPKMFLTPKSTNSLTVADESDIEKSQESEASNSSMLTESKSDSDSKTDKSQASKVKNSELTPKKSLSPKQLQKRLESAKRREEKEKEREEKKQKLLEEKKLKNDEREKQRLEKEKQKQMELELKEEKKRKELELKEEKRRKEQEEKDLKRKEREEKIEQKRKELEDKNKEKQKEENKKQKISAAFVNFFTKKTEVSTEEKVEVVSTSTFMPFEVKSDMKLAPLCRKHLDDREKSKLVSSLKEQDSNAKTYLEELKSGKEVGKSGKTWIEEELDDVVVVEDLGESIVHQAELTQKLRAKFLKFHENRRPAYHGTWRKKSKYVKPLKPLDLDKEHFNYDVDSDEDWEEEDPGESVGGSDDEEKDEPENEYEVDNDFFVPHGHLSEDEVEDEEDQVANPEDHKLKLKLLKKEFDDEMNEKAHKLKPRVIGCIWYEKDEKNVDENIHKFLKSFFIISRGQIKINKRPALAEKKENASVLKTIANPLSEELVPEFLKFVHGNTNGQKVLVKEFLNNLKSKNINSDASQNSLIMQMKHFAEWKKIQNKLCWRVRETVMEHYKVELSSV